MEKWFSYKQSKTIDKSLSYLSGVGEDLSFDISYFMRLSECAARYYDGALFLNFSTRISLEDKEEFGELFERKFDDTSYFLFGEKYIRKEFFIHDNSDFVSRFRNTKFDIYEYFDFLFTNTDITIFNRHIDLSDNIQSGIYSVDLLSFYKISRPIVGFKQLFAKENGVDGLTDVSGGDFVGAPKGGGQEYGTEKNISGKGSESILTDRSITASGIEELKTNVFTFKFADQGNKNINLDNIISASTQTINIAVDEQLNLSNESPDILIEKDSVVVSTTDTNLNLHPCEDSLDYNDKEASYGEELHIGIPTKLLAINNLYENVYNETPDINLFDDVFVGYRDKETDMDNNGFMIGIPLKGTIIESQDMLSSGDKTLNTTNKYYTVGSDFKEAPSMHSEITVGQGKNGTNLNDYNASVATNEAGTYIESANKYHVDHQEKELNDVNTTNVVVSKYEKTAFGQDTIMALGKSIKGAGRESNIFISKWGKSTFSYDTGSVGKSSKKLIVYDIFNIHRESDKGIYSVEVSVMFKYNRVINDSALDEIRASKSSKGILDDSGDMVFRPNIDGVMGIDDILVSKAFKSLQSEELSHLVTRDIPYCMDYYNTITQASKSLRSIGEVDMSMLITKSPYSIYSQLTDSWFKKEYRDVYENSNLLNISKKPYDTSISEHNMSISKNRVDTYLSMYSVMFEKNYRPTDVNRLFDNIKKDYRPTDATNRSLWYKLPMREYRVNKLIVMAYKNYRSTDTTSRNVLFKPGYRYTYKNKEDVNFETLKSFCYLKQGFVQTPGSSGIITNDTVEVENKYVQETTINPELHASSIIRDANFDRSSGFGYVEKPDYALIKDDRTDELQLPSSDFNYSNFAKKLFVDGSIDQKYVKREDENGNLFINLPIENPIRHFADLATEYIDLNVGMLIYIIEKAYNIWQNKIFTYSAMPSDSALNDILRKLKENLHIQYPSEDDQYHLHRAIRLFRWYAEMSILNNAEYMLKLKYKVLEVDYANKDLSPFNDIATFDNMQVDNTFILTAVDNTLPCGFTLDLVRGHKVRLKFVAAITGGKCVINVNDKSDTYTEQMLEFDEELLPGHNVIHVTFEQTEPTSYFGIMKLSIENYSVSSYDISYVGKIGESNMTINHLIGMLSVCGDSIDLIQKTVAHATPTVNALDQMRVYFDLHHEDKLKGRRLITKH